MDLMEQSLPTVLLEISGIYVTRKAKPALANHSLCLDLILIKT